MIVKTIDVSFSDKKAPSINARYGEVERQYKIYTDVPIYENMSALLQIAKPDGQFTENGVEVHIPEDDERPYLVMTIPTQATIAKGVGRYSICIYDTDLLLYSCEGKLWIDDNLITDEMIESISEVNGAAFPQDFLTVNDIDTLTMTIEDNMIIDDETAPNKTWSSDKIAEELANVEVDDMTGATAGTAGAHGLVPAPAAGEEGKFLSGAGTWEDAGGLHVFSTNEQIVGTWIDGRPVYEKTFDLGTLTANNTNIYHGISNFDRIVRAYGSTCFYNGSPSIPLVNYTGGTMFSGINDCDSSRFILYVSSDILTYYKYNAVLTVQYVKTS